MGAGPKIQCNHCGTVIQSRHRHYMDWCSCVDESKAVAIDGGDDYTKVSQGENANYTFVTQDEEEPEDKDDIVMLFDRLDQIVDDYEVWEEEHPPRRGKTSLPKHGVDGRSIFTIVDTQRKKADNASKR